MFYRILTIACLLLLVTESTAHADQKVNLNQANVSTLTTVPGITPQLGLRIVKYRNEHGPYKTFEDLLRVPGVTKLTLLKSMDYLVITTPSGKTKKSSQRKLDLNKASFAQLLLLPSMTPRVAKSIVDYRETTGNFGKVQDLEKVPNLDKMILLRIRNLLYVSGAPKSKRILVPTRKRSTVRAAQPARSKKKTNRQAQRTPAPTNDATSKNKGNPPEPLQVRSNEIGRINLNTASKVEIMGLPRMTNEGATEIIKWRQENGRFSNTHELVNVPLFGEAAYHRLKNKISVAP